jgi:hypothetical protein
MTRRASPENRGDLSIRRTILVYLMLPAPAISWGSGPAFAQHDTAAEKRRVPKPRDEGGER